MRSPQQLAMDAERRARVALRVATEWGSLCVAGLRAGQQATGPGPGAAAARLRQHIFAIRPVTPARGARSFGNRYQSCYQPC